MTHWERAVEQRHNVRLQERRYKEEQEEQEQEQQEQQEQREPQFRLLHRSKAVVEDGR